MVIPAALFEAVFSLKHFSLQNHIAIYSSYFISHRAQYKAGALGEAVKLVVKAIQIYDQDPNVLEYADKLNRKMKQRAAAAAMQNRS